MRGGEGASVDMKPLGPEVGGGRGSPGEDWALPGRPSRRDQTAWAGATERFACQAPRTCTWLGLSGFRGGGADIPRPAAACPAQRPRGPPPSHFHLSNLRTGFGPSLPLLRVPQATLGHLKSPSCCPWVTSLLNVPPSDPSAHFVKCTLTPRCPPLLVPHHTPG